MLSAGLDNSFCAFFNDADDEAGSGECGEFVEWLSIGEFTVVFRRRAMSLGSLVGSFLDMLSFRLGPLGGSTGEGTDGFAGSAHAPDFSMSRLGPVGGLTDRGAGGLAAAIHEPDSSLSRGFFWV